MYKREKYCPKMDKELAMNFNEKGVAISSGDADSRGMPRSRLWNIVNDYLEKQIFPLYRRINFNLSYIYYKGSLIK